MITIFLLFMLFEKSVAAAAAVFLIFGDLCAKFYGIYFGRTRIFEKTLEGSLAFFTASLLAAYVISHLVPLPFFICLTGAVAAAVIELLPLGVNDNFSVGILSGAVMSVFSLF
jgi:glycerol-3-phosphate acyltransferase PlsY